MRTMAKGIALLLVIAAASALWWLETLRRTEPDEAAATGERHQPEAYFNQFQLRRHTGTGQPTNVLRGQRLVRYADDATTTIVRPQLHYRPADAAPWDITAERGHLGPKQDRLELTGDVFMARRASPGQQLTIETPELTVYQSASRARTQARVRLRGRAWRTTAVGMQAFLDRSRVHLRSEVWSRYMPSRRANNG